MLDNPCIGCQFFDPDEGCLPGWEDSCAMNYDPLPWEEVMENE